MFDFEVLNNLLEDARAGCRAAECHGFICAQICVADNMDDGLLTEYLLGNTTDDILISECRNQLRDLADIISNQFTATEFELNLMLPDDETPLKMRGLALVEWCQGFLSGIGIAGLGSSGTMSAESKELIDDLYNISRLDTENLDEETTQDEFDLVELVEYVRMGVILIYDEFHGLHPNKELPDILH